MNAASHKVATDALETLGTCPIPDNSGRDAIHLAVEPAVAGMTLKSGERIKIANGKAVRAILNDATGIVDPFIKTYVDEGERFWLVVLPRTITSLRHVWSHPDFPEEGVVSAAPANSKEASEAWLHKFIDSADCPDYHTVIGAALHNDSWSKEYLHFDGQDAHGEIPPEFWDHVEIVTGQKIERKDRASYFSCSC